MTVEVDEAAEAVVEIAAVSINHSEVSTEVKLPTTRKSSLTNKLLNCERCQEFMKIVELFKTVKFFCA